MTVLIKCTCGETLRVQTGASAGSVRCPACGRAHLLPTVMSSARRNTVSGTESEKLRKDARLTWVPIVRASLACALILLGLIWAMLSLTGGGVGGSGRGTGTASGDGSGTGELGNGSGAGREGDGTGAGTPGSSSKASTVSRDKPTKSAAPFPQAPAEEPQSLGFVNRKIEPAPEPIVEPVGNGSGDAGKEGAAGGGSGASNGGRDPGARGDISVTLTWSYEIDEQGIKGKGGPDIDLWIVDPLGQKLSSSRDGCGIGPTPQGGGRIDMDDQGAYGGASDVGKGGGPERAYWPKGAAPKGKYKYGVTYFKGEGFVNYTVNVYLGDKLAKTHRGKLSQNSRGNPKELGEIETQ